MTPAVFGDYVYFGTEAGEFLCVDWKKAETLWTDRPQRGGQPYRASAAVDDNRVIVGSRNRTVRALDPHKGTELWVFAAKQRIDSSPVLVGDRVFVGAGDGRIYERDAATGEQRWEFETGGGFTGSPAVADQRLVIASDDGVVYCFGRK